MTGRSALAALTADAAGGAATLTAAVADGVDLPRFAVAVLAAEGEQTADRRIFEAGAFTWREPPLTLTLNHDPDQRIGRVVALGRTDAPDQLTVDNFDSVAGDSGAYVIGLIEFDLGTNSAGEVVNPDALGRSVALEVDGGFLEGVSVEFGNEAYDVDCLEEDEDGWCIDYLLVFTAAEIGQVTLTGFQAIGSARVLGTSGGDGSSDDAEAASGGEDRQSVTAGARWLPPVPAARRATVTASAARRVAPSAADFADPGFTAPTALTVDGDRIYGHAALWNTCHVGIADECVMAPRSPSGYAYFHTGEVELDDGSSLAVGVITMGTGHAPIYDGQRRVVSAQAAAAHYDNTGTQAAWVRAGEDEHGIWLAGVLNPGLNDLQRRTLRAGAASGDWRRIGGSLELVATLAVNVPGFPVPRTQGMVAGGLPAVLVAAGVTTGRGCGCSNAPADVTGLERRIARLEATVAAAGVEDAALAALAASVRPGP